jgi:hypothetical protein
MKQFIFGQTYTNSKLKNRFAQKKKDKRLCDERQNGGCKATYTLFSGKE